MVRALLLVPADARSIERAAALLRRSGVVAFPTDTVYGLGAHSAKASGIGKLYLVKERDRLKAIPVLLGRVDDLSLVASSIPELAWRLADRFWPGGVTLVVPRAATVLDVLTGGGDSVAVRVPAHPVALELIRALGAPLAATSANLSGQSEAVTAEEVRHALGSRVGMILDGGRCPGGIPSTVVDVTVSPAVIRRRGAMVAQVEELIAQMS